MEDREKLSKLQDVVAEQAGDWDEMLEMVAVLPQSRESLDFLELLVPRLKMMSRKLNQVELLHLPEGNCWRISNYSYEVYRYFITHYPDTVIATPHTLSFPEIKTRERDNDFLRSKLSAE